MWVCGCVAVCCSVLPCVSQCVAVLRWCVRIRGCACVLQCVAVCCRVCRSVLKFRAGASVYAGARVCCSVLQCVAVCCRVCRWSFVRVLMTLRHALKAISSSIAERSLDVPIFISMLHSDGINCMRTECLRRGKLCEQHTASEQDAHSSCSHVPTACRRRDPRDHAAACLPQSTSD